MSHDLQRKLERHLFLIGWGGGVVGALVIFATVGLFFPAFGGSVRDNITSGWANAPVIAVTLLLAGWIQTRMSRRHVEKALRWLIEERPPDDREHQLTLGLAAFCVKLDVVAWCAAAVLFAVFNGLVFSWGLAAIVAATIWLGGETTCALGYLLYERALRPITALALAARPAASRAAPGVRLRLGMAWLLGTGVPLVGLLVLGVASAAGWTHRSQYVG